jgi:hypothetical protein
MAEAVVVQPVAESPAAGGLRLGVFDRAVVVTILSRVLGVITAPLSLYFTIQYLSDAERGYHYTFYSLLGFSALFDGGVSFSAQQFISREAAHLEVSPGGLLVGPAEGVARLSALFRQTCRWYSRAALAFAVLLFLAGGVFFWATAKDDIPWQIPWLLCVATSAVSLVTSPLIALVTGIGRVESIAASSAARSFASAVTLCGLLACGAGLFAGPLSGLAGCFVWLFAMLGRWLPLVRQTATCESADDPINWGAQVWPMQWRMAVSIACGFFIFRAITPVVFSTCGSIEAGRFGLTQMAIDFAAQVSSSWLAVRTPLMAKLHSLRSAAALDRLFRSTFWISVAGYCGCIAMGMGLLWLLRPLYPRLSNAFLGTLPFALLAAWTLTNQLLQLFATYCRTAGNEPFMAISIASAVATLLGAMVCGTLAGMSGIAVWLAVHNAVIFVPWAWLIYKQVRASFAHEQA